MAKKLLLTYSASGQPLGTDAYGWTANGLDEQDAAMVISKIGVNYDPATVYILHGAVLSEGGGTSSVSQGMCFVGGVFYVMAAATFGTPGGGDVVIVDFLTAYADGGGTTFEDLSVHQVQESKYMQASSGAPASGSVGDYSNFVPIQSVIEARTDLASDTLTFTRDNLNIIYSTPFVNGSTITLDFANARVGAKVTLRVSGAAFSAVIAGGATLVTQSITLAVGTGYVTLVFEYLGKIVATDYVGFTIME